MDDLRKDCQMRHENGNCTVIGGFCTAVNDPICEGLHSAYDRGYRAAALRAQQERENPKQITNADRIRAMSDEELANVIARNAYTGACNDFGISYDGKCCHDCEKCDAIIKWLQQPAEGE